MSANEPTTEEIIEQDKLREKLRFWEETFSTSLHFLLHKQETKVVTALEAATLTTKAAEIASLADLCREDFIKLNTVQK